MYRSLREALTDTFPHLEFDGECVIAVFHILHCSSPPPPPTKQKEVKPRGHWKLVANCKKLFDEYARRQGFDPLNPENWYSVDLELLGAKQVIDIPFFEHV